MAENIKVTEVIPASSDRLFAAWLDPHEHSRMTGGSATDEGGGRFTAWDGYITGRTLSAVPHSKIVQSWRTTEFPAGVPDSMLTVLFEPEGAGTRITFVHENIPAGQAEAYEQGWHEHYFTPMKRAFSSPAEKLREVGERITQTFEEVTGQVEVAANDALQAVGVARVRARKQAVKAVKAVKKAQKTAARRLKAVGKKVKALVTKKRKKKPAPAAKSKAKARPKAKPTARRAPKKKKVRATGKSRR